MIAADACPFAMQASSTPRQAPAILSGTMGALEPPDSHYLLAATGWLELGNAAAAAEELDQIQPLLRGHPDVLELRFQICAAAANWDEAWKVAQALVLEVPEHELEIVKRELPLKMTQVAQLRVPLVAEVGVGANWDEAH